MPTMEKRKKGDCDEHSEKSDQEAPHLLSHSDQAAAAQSCQTRAACRAFAERSGYDVVGVFLDEGVSGLEIDRSGMGELLDYLRSNRRRGPHAVIAHDVRPLGGFTAAILHYQYQLRKLGAKLEHA